MGGRESNKTPKLVAATSHTFKRRQSRYRRNDATIIVYHIRRVLAWKDWFETIVGGSPKV